MEKYRRLIYSDSIPMSQITELQDDLLVLILSKLTIKEAARTSVLSHKWEKLWVYYAGSLNFDNLGATFNTRRLSIERPRFINWVNHVINLLRSSTVDEFRVRFELDASYGDDIERWIEFAMEKKVFSLELDFSGFHGAYNNKHHYSFPSKLLDSPNNLLSSFGSLTSLRLDCVDLYDEVLAYLLSKCQSLEQLSITKAASLTYLNATTALKLKHLEIEYCHRLQNVDISNTNIESLKFNGNWKTQSSLKTLHLLREVSLNWGWCGSVVSRRFSPLPISQLQSLELKFGGSFYMGTIRFAEVFPTFCNLKHLKVSLSATPDQNIFCLTSLICASPVLNSFTLEVLYLKLEPDLIPDICKQFMLPLPNCEWRKTEKRVHECLKVVEFIGWCGHKCELDIVGYLIEKSAGLEKVIIALDLYLDKDKKKTVKEDCEKLLQEYVPPGMELVIL